MGLEPVVDLALRGDALVDVARLVAQVEHHAVTHRLVELVGVDVAAEDLDAALLVALEQGRAGEADEDRVGQDGLHRVVQQAGLGAVAFVHEDVEPAPRLEAWGQRLADRFDKPGHVPRLAAVVFVARGLPADAAELVDQRADQPRPVVAQHAHEVGAVTGAVELFLHAVEDLLDLGVEFGAVGDDEDAGVGDVFADPFGQPHHRQALAHRITHKPPSPERTERHEQRC